MASPLAGNVAVHQRVAGGRRRGRRARDAEMDREDRGGSGGEFEPHVAVEDVGGVLLIGNATVRFK